MPAQISATSITASPAAAGPRSERSRSEVARMALRQTQARAVQERQQDRVETLVQRMEALAQRISSNRVNRSQRSVLVARFNDLQRQVNELDGIVGSEGREARGQESIGRAAVANQKRVEVGGADRPAAGSARRGRVQTTRRAPAVRLRPVRQPVAQALSRFEAAKPEKVRSSAGPQKQAARPTSEKAAGGQPGRASQVDLIT